MKINKPTPTSFVHSFHVAVFALLLFIFPQPLSRILKFLCKPGAVSKYECMFLPLVGNMPTCLSNCSSAITMVKLHNSDCNLDQPELFL